MNPTRHPSNRRAATWYYDRGQKLYHAGRYRRAAGAFARSIRRAPGSPMAYAGRGLSLAQLSRSQRAVRNLERAMALAAETGHFDAPAWLTHAAHESGRAYERLGSFYMALRCYTKALELTASSGAVAPHEILRRRGRVYLRLKQAKRAIEDLDQSIALAPEEATPYLIRAHAHRALDNAAAAVIDLRTYLRLTDAQPTQRAAALADLADLTE